MPARLRYSWLLLVLTLPLLGGGCRQTGLTRKGDELLLMAPMRTAEVDTWQGALDKFEAKTKIKVVLVPVLDRDQYYQQLRQTLGGKQGPDVAVIEGRYLPEFAPKLTDLRTYFSSQKELRVADYYPATWKSGFYQNNMVGLPNDIDGVALAVNHNLTDISVITIPDEPMTWTEFHKAAKDMARDTDDPHTAIYGTALTDWWEVFAWQNGGEIVDNDANPTRSTLSDPKTQQALEYLAKLVLADKLATPPASAGHADPADLFRAGRLGMIPAMHRDLTALSAGIDFAVTVADAPSGTKQANIQLGSSFCISRGSPQADKAWQLLAYLGSDYGQRELSKNSSTIPARSTLTESSIYSETGKGVFVPYLNSLKVARPAPATPHWAEIEAIYKRELAKVWLGQTTVAAACKAIDDQVNKLLAQPPPANALLGPLLPARAAG